MHRHLAWKSRWYIAIVNGAAQQLHRQATLVLGMHRSGTSAVAGTIRLLGAAPPVQMLPPAPDNPTGFWESPLVIAANDWILTKTGTSWFECAAFDTRALRPDTLTTALTFIMLSLETEFDPQRLMLVKDPRICLLSDLWLLALRALRIIPTVLIVLRHPSEVIASLASRDALPLQHSGALWLGHMLTAERATRGCRRSILSYDDLMRDWRSVIHAIRRETGIAWPAEFETVASSIERFLNNRLQHQRRWDITDLRIGQAPLGVWLEKAYEALVELVCNSKGIVPLTRLDQLYSDFSVWIRDEGRAIITSLPANHPLRAPSPFEVPAAWYQQVPPLAELLVGQASESSI